MLTPPAVSHVQIAARLHEHFGLTLVHAEFLPLGADIDTAVYRIAATDDAPYFLKLRRGDPQRIAVTAPAFLHHGLGIAAVMAPIPAAGSQLQVEAEGFQWALYPYCDGANGFERALSPAQWITFGAALSAVHGAMLPADLLADMPRETYSPRCRERARVLGAHLLRETGGDALVYQLAAFWRSHQSEIDTLIERAESLGQIAATSDAPLVPCHADIHAGNVLLGVDGDFFIVDWDTLLLAPKERDLMFVGGGIGGVWNDADEDARFYRGYGSVDIDRRLLSYYRYERIVVDIVELADQILDPAAGAEDRAQGLRYMLDQFQPGHVVEQAHRAYRQLR